MTKVLSFLVVLAAALGALHLNSVVRGDPSTLQSILDNDGIHAYFPGQPGYSNVSSSFNLRLPFEPAAVAYPTTAEEVAEAVQAGASLGIPGKHSCLYYSCCLVVDAKITVTARSGGHSYAAYGLGGADGHLVVDLSNFNDISVDSVTGIATIGAGSRLGDIAIALFDQAGRALPHGTCPLVGIGGHASYGGCVFWFRTR